MNDIKVKQTQPSYKSKKQKPIFQGECIICHSVFSDLEKHIRTVHQDDFINTEDQRSDLNFHCYKCGMEFDIEQNLHAHILSAHESIDTYNCEHCFKDFDRREELDRHNETHHSNRMKYLCPYCDAGFPHSKGLKTHLIKHIGCNSPENSTSEVQDSQMEYSPTRPPEQLDQLFEELNNISDVVDEVYVKRSTDGNYRVRFTNDDEDNENISSQMESIVNEDHKIDIAINK